MSFVAGFDKSAASLGQILRSVKSAVVGRSAPKPKQPSVKELVKKWKAEIQQGRKV